MDALEHNPYTFARVIPKPRRGEESAPPPARVRHTVVNYGARAGSLRATHHGQNLLRLLGGRRVLEGYPGSKVPFAIVPPVRSRRTQSTPGNFMHENRETSVMPAEEERAPGRRAKAMATMPACTLRRRRCEGHSHTNHETATR